jgi:alkylation response protein AidB-like acyl-CoA dehydrogenase
MDFAYDDTQKALADVARQIFETHATHDRLKELEAGGQSFDADLWSTLDQAGLLSLGVDDGGFLEQCVVLVEQGRTVAPVPLWPHLVGNTFARKRVGIVTVALDEPGAEDAFARTMSASHGTLTGVKIGVPAWDEASTVVVSAHDGLYVVNADELVAERTATTARFPEFALTFDATPVERIEGDPAELGRRAIVALCAIGVGVAERALELTATYTSARQQFDKPLGSFQAVQQRAADAYIDVEAMRVTMWEAAWRISEGLDADHAVSVAKFWAAEGGQRVVSSAQHLHGGMGADIDYPLHRYTLWSKWIELAFGGATPTLARLGAELVR